MARGGRKRAASAALAWAGVVVWSLFGAASGAAIVYLLTRALT